MDTERYIAITTIIGGTGAYLRWALVPMWIAYEIGKVIGGRRARKAAEGRRLSLSARR